MAVLGATTLTGCNSIPSFIATGSRMVFEQTDAPTSWTKELDSSFNDVALRVVNGPAGSGPPANGIPFQTCFPSSPRVLAAIPFSGPSNLTLNQPPAPILTLNPSPSGASITQSSVLQTQTRSHLHDYSRRGDALVPRLGGTTQGLGSLLNPETVTTGTTGNDGVHQHGITDNGHTHPIPSGQHTHTLTDSGHSHQFIMTGRDFYVSYVDVIICTKN